MRQINPAVARVREEMAEAAVKAGRKPEEIALLAVTKTRTPAEVNSVLAAGIRTLGENRVQEAQEKIPLVSSSGEWHLIGHLQTNKARQAVKLFQMIQSVDSTRLAQKIDECVEPGRPMDVLIEVNTSGEASKFGVAPENVASLVDAVAALPRLRLRGFMTIGALSSDEALVRRCFESLRRIFDDTRRQCASASVEILSMGMTNDFRWAIAEGSTMVRIGTALFGERRQGEGDV